MQTLNEQQKNIVELDVVFPILVIAGAGTGKTSVLINRIAYLISNKNLNHKNVYVISFSRKSVEEVEKRIKSVGCEIPNISTFHSFCLRWLKKIDKFKDYELLDNASSIKIWSEIIKSIHCEGPKLLKNIFQLMNIYSYIQVKLKSEDKRQLFNLLIKYEDIFISWEEFSLFIEKYSTYKKKNKLYDFNDILLYFNNVLNVPKLVNAIELKIDSLLIDEFQDIDEVQFSIIKKLISITKANIFCVGDPWQSIYRFRGSSSSIFKDFQEHFKDCSINYLNLNYRSTPQILNVANNLILPQQIKYKLFKNKLITNNSSGDFCEWISYYSESKILDWILKKIQDILVLRETKNTSIAIIYRINIFSHDIEEFLEKNNIPYEILGSTKLFKNIVAKGLIGYLKLLHNDDSSSLLSIVNAPNRFIKASTIDEIKNASYQNNMSFFDFVMKKNIESYVDLTDHENSMFWKIKRCVQEIRGLKKNNFSFEQLINEIGNITNLKESNVFLIIKKIILYKKPNNKSEESYINDLYESYYSKKKLNNKFSIVISTIHQVKGMEFDYVFIYRVDKNIMPYYKSITDSDAWEEERRIFYVAITRAKKSLFLCTKKTDDNDSVFIENIKNDIKII